MAGFLHALQTQTFMQNAVIVGLLASAACAMVGTYVVVKRITFISGGIAHAVLGGMGVAYFLNRDPLAGALVASIVAALIIGIVSLRARQREDTIIGALWAVGMAVGIVFMHKTEGYQVDLMNYLFGNILLVTRGDVFLTLALDVGILGAVLLFYKRFLGICFDEEFTRIQGVQVDVFYLLLLCLIALTVVILVQVVGIILVIALLTLPAATAGHYGRSLKQMMVIALVVGAACTTGGLALSYPYDLPSGATIVLIAGGVYLASTVLNGVLRRGASAAGKARERE
ncbi:MAG: metal ABC transporter permease [Candidatus Brocadiia bacterium]